jgi:hypothetical protein
MERDHIKNDARRAGRASRLGQNPQCVLCPERRRTALTLVTRKFLQLHHVAGRANDPRLLVPLCLNCHADLTDQYRSAGIPMTPAGNILDRVIACLRGVATFLPGLGQACRRWAEQLERFSTMLDERLPGWRGMPEAR